jgi:phosphatidylethanolamine-binding protein
MVNNDSYFGQVRHWLAVDVSVDVTGKVIVAKDKNISPYIGPAHLPNYMFVLSLSSLHSLTNSRSPRPHRYIFILCQPIFNSGTLKVTADDLKAIQQHYPTFDESKTTQELKDRGGFNVQKLIEKKHLKVVAATYMFVAGTWKNAPDET